MTARVLTVTPEGLAHVTRRVPCPECGGDGGHWSYWTKRQGKRALPPAESGRFIECARCDGDGTVPAAIWVPAPGKWTPGTPVVVVVEQPCWEHNPKCSDDPCPAGIQWLCPTRQVIAATADATEALPVVDVDTYLETPRSERVKCIVAGARLWVATSHTDPVGTDVDAVDPGPFTWTLGDSALHLTNVTVLDPPVSDMVCPTCEGDPRSQRVVLTGPRGFDVFTCDCTDGRVPLRVNDGDEVTW